MKTISQIAKELNMSRQNVYLTVKQAGIEIDTLDNEKIGNKRLFSDEAVETIMSACLSRKKKTVKQECVSTDNLTKLKDLEMQIVKLTNELTETRDTLTKTLEELTRAHQEISRLQAIEEEQLHTIASLSETVRMTEKQKTLRLEAEQPMKISFRQWFKQKFLSNHQ